MERGMNKIVIVTQKTRLQELKERFNTKEQAQFYVEHLGADFNDYLEEDRIYEETVTKVTYIAAKYARISTIDKTFICQYMFGKDDIIICVGRDGLVVNTMKYLVNSNPVIGVNPDADRWDGVVLPFTKDTLESIIPYVLSGEASKRAITFAHAMTQNGQELYAANDIFIGPSSHISARYDISYKGQTESQSSSGVIVSTGLGQTGWFKSIIAQVSGSAEFLGFSGAGYKMLTWEEKALTFAVREPYPSVNSNAGIVMGKIAGDEKLILRSNMAEKGVIFSDGIENDYIEFNSGTEVTISVADKQGMLVMN